MNNARIIIAAGAVGLLATCVRQTQVVRPGAAASVAGVSPCLTGHASTAGHLHYLRISSIGTTRNDSLWRAGTQIPVIHDTASITVMSDSTLCRSAVNAYNAVVTPDSAVTEIELLRADTVFVASHPAVMSGEFVSRYVFDRSFAYLGNYLK